MTEPGSEIDWDEILSTVQVIGNVKERWESEVQHLTPWVIGNLNLLGRELGMRLTFVDREVRLGNFRADIVAHDETGRKVVIENQFGPTDHLHFAQVVLYACEAEADVVVWLSAGSTFRIGNPVRPEHQKALKRLNVAFAGQTSFYAVGLELLTAPGVTTGPLLPQLTVAVQPEPT